MADKDVYLAQARTLRDHGIRRGFRLLAERYLADRVAQQYPSPLRWLWVLWLSKTLPWPLTVPIASVFGLAGLATWYCGPLAGALTLSSPLLWVVARRPLQDAPVALLTVCAALAAYEGNEAATGMALFALLAFKEVSPLAWPAVILAGLFGEARLLPLSLAMVLAALGWAGSLFLLFGRRAPDLLRAALRSHATPYTRDHQRGGPHRLGIDLALLSPVVMVGAALTRDPLILFALALVAPHALSPVQNVRTVVAADVALRCACAALGPATVVAMIAVDLWVLWCTRKIYDPVTANLTAAMGMSPRHSS